MHEFWTIPTANMTYTRSQNYTIWWLANIEYKHSTLWLLCCCFWCCCFMFLSPQVHVPYKFWTSGSLNTLKCQFNIMYPRYIGITSKIFFFLWGYKWGVTGVQSDTRDFCGAIGDRAQVILVWMRVLGIENAFHPRRLGVTRVRPWAIG
jgi:hypothetical protein